MGSVPGGCTMKVRLLLAAVILIPLGFITGGFIAADTVRRDRAPEFQHLAGPLILRENPDADADTVRTLPAGTIIRLGVVYYDGWAAAGDVRNHFIGYIDSNSDVIVEGLPDRMDAAMPMSAAFPMVERLAKDCGIEAREAAVLLRRTVVRMVRPAATGSRPSAATPDFEAALVAAERSIRLQRDSAHIALSCHDAARLAAAFPLP